MRNTKKRSNNKKKSGGMNLGIKKMWNDRKEKLRQKKVQLRRRKEAEEAERLRNEEEDKMTRSQKNQKYVERTMPWNVDGEVKRLKALLENNPNNDYGVNDQYKELIKLFTKGKNEDEYEGTYVKPPISKKETEEIIKQVSERVNVPLKEMKERGFTNTGGKKKRKSMKLKKKSMRTRKGKGVKSRKYKK